jgi:hypothetical protein
MKIINISKDTSASIIFIITFPSSNQCAMQDWTRAQCTLRDRYGNSFERFVELVDAVSDLHSNIIKHGMGSCFVHFLALSRDAWVYQGGQQLSNYV